MKIKDIFKDMNVSTLFVLLLIIWLIDLAITLYGLNFSKNYLIESNRLASWFFSNGFIGILSWVSLVSLALLIYSYIVIWGKNYINKTSPSSSFLIPFVAVLTFYSLEICIIINNILHIL